MLINSPDPRSELFRLSVRGLLRRETRGAYPSSSRASSEPARITAHKKQQHRAAAATNEGNNTNQQRSSSDEFQGGLRRVIFFYFSCFAHGTTSDRGFGRKTAWSFTAPVSPSR